MYNLECDNSPWNRVRRKEEHLDDDRLKEFERCQERAIWIEKFIAPHYDKVVYGFYRSLKHKESPTHIDLDKLYIEQLYALLSQKLGEENDIIDKIITVLYPAGLTSYKTDESRREGSQRRAIALKRATPSWLTKEHHQQIKDIEAEARRLTKITGISYHVDHIIPLQGKNVSGLHVPWNLQILKAEDNLKKSNKFDEESDEYWITKAASDLSTNTKALDRLINSQEIEESLGWTGWQTKDRMENNTPFYNEDDTDDEEGAMEIERKWEEEECSQ